MMLFKFGRRAENPDKPLPNSTHKTRFRSRARGGTDSFSTTGVEVAGGGGVVDRFLGEAGRGGGDHLTRWHESSDAGRSARKRWRSPTTTEFYPSLAAMLSQKSLQSDPRRKSGSSRRKALQTGNFRVKRRSRE